MFDATSFQERLTALDSLLREVEHWPDAKARDSLQRIVQSVLDLHRTGLERLLDHLAEAGERGAELRDECAQDEVIAGMLLLHDLHPLGLEERVGRALESVRPYLRSHGGNVELLEISDGVVRLRLEGSCHSCPSSTVTMQQTIEEAIYAKAPDVLGIEVEGLPEEPAEEKASARVALTLV